MEMAVVELDIWILMTCFTWKKIGANILCSFDDNAQEILECNRSNYTDFTVLQRALVSDNYNVTSILLSSCGINEINLDAFEGLPLLQKLDLSGNFLQYLTVGIFHRLVILVELNLSFNLIWTLPVGLFNLNAKLKTLKLNGNYITSFEIGIFGNLVELNTLDLSENYIEGENVDHQIFANNPNVESLNFFGNNMSQTPHNLLRTFTKLKYLNLKQCSLIEFPPFLMAPNLKSLSTLILKDNVITKIENVMTFDNFVNLALLDLSKNKLNYIGENSFRRLTSLSFINLRRNKLKSIPKNLFNSMSKLLLVNLSHNLLTSLPDNLFKRTSLKFLNVSYNRITYLQSNFFSNLKNSGSLFKYFIFNNNPWQCACLIDLLREINNLNIIYNNTYFNGEHPVCVTTDEFICNRQESVSSFYTELFKSTVI